MDWFGIIVIGLGLICGISLFIGSLITEHGSSNRSREYLYRIVFGIGMFIIANVAVWIWISFFYMIFIIIFK